MFKIQVKLRKWTLKNVHEFAEQIKEQFWRNFHKGFELIDEYKNIHF